jgi:hypothetical protein
MKNTRLNIAYVEENVCTKHVYSYVCIAINDGCEFKYIHGHRWISTNVDECQQIKFIHNYQTPFICSIITFTYMLLFHPHYD